LTRGQNESMLPEFSAGFLKKIHEGIDGPPAPPPAQGYASTSVFLLIFNHSGQPFMLAIVKADTDGYPWANQVALPGGHIDESDSGPLGAAFRELQEEVGISPDQVTCIGSIGHFQTISSKDIEVFLGIWNSHENIVNHDIREISKILKLPIEQLLDIHISRQYCNRTPDVFELLYPVQDVVIWGVTARILHHFLEEVIKQVPVSLLSPYEAVLDR
jgi:peroxisomal coenzyme A diphosphatase NUDT7